MQCMVMYATGIYL